MAEDQEEKPSFRVVDKRRIDAEGNDREEVVEPPPSTPSGTAPTESDPSDSRGQGRDAITFSSFVLSLATQVLVELGEVAPPEGMSVPLDKEAAKHTIDVIGMLEEKTRGNLDSDEQKLLTEVLHHLRLCYVRRK